MQPEELEGETINNHLLLEKIGRSACVTFNRPEVRNAITREMLATLADFLMEIERDENINVLVFRGNGAHFTAGGDVGGFQETLALRPEERQRSYERRLIGNSDPFLLLSRMSIPIITVARGAVAGAGLVFALAADFCLVSEDAFFVFAHAQIGLPPDLGMSFYLPRVVGWKQAKVLTLSSARLNAQQAMALGIVNEVLTGDALDVRAAELIQRLAAGPREALRHAKRLLNASLDNSIATQLELEARAVGQCVAHPDFVEGVSAFLERRKPTFGG